MNNNLDVWAIQYYPEELYYALSNIKDGISVLYSNLHCDLKIGKSYINSRQFNTALYNEESDILILLMRDGKVGKEDIIKYLEENNKQYAEVTFLESIYGFKDGDNIPELWFLREKYDVEKALKDSKSKGFRDCEYYPNLKSFLNLRYIPKHGFKVYVDGRKFKGLIKFQDKIILLVNQKGNRDEFGKSRNMTNKEILELLKKYRFRYRSIINQEPNVYVDNFSKSLKKELKR